MDVTFNRIHLGIEEFLTTVRLLSVYWSIQAPEAAEYADPWGLKWLVFEGRCGL